jgi:oxygen-dependent protoporphyrinogen oxidase
VTGSGEPIACDGAVIAVPAFEAASIVRSLDDGAARELEAIGHASVAVATLVLPPGSFTPPGDTSGLLVSSAEDLTMSACTWYSAKWPTRAPSDGRVVLRCFVGRSRDDPAVELPDGELIGRLRADLRTTVGIVAEPLESAVVRWERGLPQYEVGHLDRVARVEQALAPHPGIALAGASLRGSGLTDCVRQANAAATRVLDGALLRGS